MKKLAMAIALALTLSISTSAIAAPQDAAYANDPTVLACVERMEAQKDFAKSLLDSGRITQEIYDACLTNIDAKIDYILVNGVGSACGSGGMGMGGGACGRGGAGMGGGACGGYGIR